MRSVPKLDVIKLTRDVDRRCLDRPYRVAPSGRPTTGVMGVVLDNIDQLENLHATGTTWVDIAASLAAQGVRHGSGEARIVQLR